MVLYDWKLGVSMALVLHEMHQGSQPLSSMETTELKYREDTHVSVYKHFFCYSNVPTSGTKDPLFQKPVRLCWLAH